MRRQHHRREDEAEARRRSRGATLDRDRIAAAEHTEHELGSLSRQVEEALHSFTHRVEPPVACIPEQEGRAQQGLYQQPYSDETPRDGLPVAGQHEAEADQEQQAAE